MDEGNEVADDCTVCGEPFEGEMVAEDCFGNRFHDECKPEDEDEFLS